MALTAKQQAFVQEYLIDLNGAAAAIRAGYSPKSADKIAYQLLEKTRVKEALKKAIEERSKRTEITADEVLKEYAKIARADIKDFLSFRTEKTVVDYDDRGKPIIDYKQIVDVKPSDQIDGTLINEVSISKDGTLKFKLHDKKGALDMIGKHLGMFTDKLELSGQVAIKKLEDFF
jgi:phage terminase small subunit